MRSSVESPRSVVEVIAETDRLILRNWRDEDRADYIAACNTDAVTRFLGGPATIEQIDAALERISRSQREHGFSFWALERRDDAAFLGYCGLKIVGDPEIAVKDDVESGWRLREDAWGQGYASEAAKACLDWAWAHLDVQRVVAMTTPANQRSWRLMERIGMTRRRDLDFNHPQFAADHLLSRHITYVIERP